MLFWKKKGGCVVFCSHYKNLIVDKLTSLRFISLTEEISRQPSIDPLILKPTKGKGMNEFPGKESLHIWGQVPVPAK